LSYVGAYESLQAHSTKGKGKGIVHPGTGHKVPEGEYKFSSTLSLSLALDGGGWPGRFTPAKNPINL